VQDKHYTHKRNIQGGVMQVGESIEVFVFANKIWNNTGIQLERLNIYRFEVSTSDKWSDASISANANGFTSPNGLMRASEWLRRGRQSNWLTLMGSIDRHTHFAIGTKLVKTMTESGILHCYANDVLTMYWNNKGSVKLKVTRTQ
jgi:hypothetical protein